MGRKGKKSTSGPGNTAQWILLIFVALLLLIPVYRVGKWALAKFADQGSDVQSAAEELLGK